MCYSNIDENSMWLLSFENMWWNIMKWFFFLSCSMLNGFLCVCVEAGGWGLFCFVFFWKVTDVARICIVSWILFLITMFSGMWHVFRIMQICSSSLLSVSQSQLAQIKLPTSLADFLYLFQALSYTCHHFLTCSRLFLSHTQKRGMKTGHLICFQTLPSERLKKHKSSTAAW